MDIRPFRILSLCSGIGGLELGLALAVENACTVCYVEREAYAAEVLATRIKEGFLDDAPIWTNLETFDGKPWRGAVDCISAGFPCQPVSVAGKRKAQDDERWIWPDITRIVREVGPGYVFLENVPGLLVRGLGDVFRDLADSGYDAEWGVFSAAEVGAPHLRKRVFILAYSGSSVGRPHLARGDGRREGPNGEGEATGRTSQPNKVLANADAALRAQPLAFPEREHTSIAGYCFPPAPNDTDGWAYVLREWPELAPAVADGKSSRRQGGLRPKGSRYEGQGTVNPDWTGGRLEDDQTAQPAIRRVADESTAGLGKPSTSRVDELRALGNAVLPLTAAHAFIELYRRLS